MNFMNVRAFKKVSKFRKVMPFNLSCLAVTNGVMAANPDRARCAGVLLITCVLWILCTHSVDAQGQGKNEYVFIIHGFVFLECY